MASAVADQKAPSSQAKRLNFMDFSLNIQPVELRNDTETIKKHHVGANLLQDAISASLRFLGLRQPTFFPEPASTERRGSSLSEGLSFTRTLEQTHAGL